MTKHQLDLYISMNDDLTRELKATHYKFVKFSKGAGTRSGMGIALVVVAKFSVGIQIKDLEAPIGATIETLAKGIGRECTAP